MLTFSNLSTDMAKRPGFVKFRQKLEQVTQEFGQNGHLDGVHVSLTPNGTSINSISVRHPTDQKPTPASMDTDAPDFSHTVRVPRYSLERLVLPKQTLDDLMISIRTLEVRGRVFDEWGLSEIEPFPRISQNFFGPSGTGKTMAADALASYLKMPIMTVTYADIASKYFGDGAKNIKRIFQCAQEHSALLFIDEADSLLSKRLTDTSQSAGQAINSMRSQVLTSIEEFSGIVIFATNLIENYDSAFKNRVHHIAFTHPTGTLVERIWEVHLPKRLPLQADVSAARLAAAFPGLVGRDIRNLVVNASVRAAVAGRERVCWDDFAQAERMIRKPEQADDVVELTAADIDAIKAGLPNGKTIQ